MKNLYRITIASVFSMLFVFTTAFSAAAITRCDLKNMSNSDARGYVDIWNTNNNVVRLYRGYSSISYPTMVNNVQKFRIRGGIGCVGRSQYSGSSYPYKGGVTYYMSTSGLYLEITTSCPI